MIRREFLRVSALGALGTGLEAAGAPSCILVWLSGGLSHLDTLDMKPEAPREIRGEFASIPTTVPGLRISEHLPLVARQAHRLTVVRSLRSGETNHERAVAHWQGGLAAPEAAVFRETDTAYMRVFGEHALPARAEPGGIERYGDTPLGRACLAARRAIEGGARFAIAGKGRPGFDTHTDNFRRLREELLPEFDRAFAALVADLDERGLLATTLVIASGEFGRSPRINAHGGRDHHASAFSALLAGAGLPRGHVVGATDRFGEEVTDQPMEPADIFRMAGTFRKGSKAEVLA